MTSAAYGSKAEPAALSRMLRPTRSVRETPTSRERAVTAAETDGWVTTSSSAAPLTDPVLATAKKLRSWVMVIDIRASVNADHSSVNDAASLPSTYGARLTRSGTYGEKRLPQEASLCAGSAGDAGTVGALPRWS